MTVKVYVPKDSAALAVGADELAQTLLSACGDSISLVRNGSRGLFWLEPLVEVETAQGRVAYGPVAVDDVPGLLAAGMLSGQAHPLCLGLTDAMAFLAKQHRVAFARMGVIDPHSLSDYEAHGGWAGLRAALAMAPDEVVQTVLDSGLRGRGGAAFPAGIKWRTVAGAQAEQKYVVCNADEGDSGTYADRMTMEGDPFMLIEGMAIAGVATGDLLVKGHWVVSRYFKEEGAGPLQDSWFPTGDVAKIDAEGYMQITDRSKDVIKSGGEWIGSIDLENIAMAHPAVAMAACIAAYHPKWDERPLLVVMLKPGAAATREDILAFFDGKIAKWWTPDDVAFVDSIPLGATGKMLKHRLREQFKDYRLPTA